MPIPENQRVAVIVLNYNEFDHTRACVESIRRSTHRPLSLIVVDGGSTDDSRSRLRGILAPHELIALSVNGGYTYGNNIGLTHAFRQGADWAFIVNNDTILDERCIETLCRSAARDSSVGILGPKVLFHSKPDVINFAAIAGRIERAEYRRIGLNEPDRGQYEDLVDTLYQDGCALMISRACFESIGGFDDWLWTYSEESDLCLRARKAGFRVCCEQRARIWHKISATLGPAGARKPHAEYYMVRNNLLFHRRHARGVLGRALAAGILLSRSPRRLASILLRGGALKRRTFLMHLAATWIGLTTDPHRPSDAFVSIKAVKSGKPGVQGPGIQERAHAA